MEELEHSMHGAGHNRIKRAMDGLRGATKDLDFEE